MKKNKDKYSPVIYWLTKKIGCIIAKKQQNTRYFCPDNVKKLRGPFILCSNHVGLWDPFLICKPFKNGVRYITSDAAFRNSIKGWFLRKLGSIPKTKGVRDSETIRNMLKVFKKGGVIGLFPEGDRSYEGKTMPLNDATGKLLKKINLPVVACLNHGTSFSHPRWSEKPNKGLVEFHYRILFTPDQLQQIDSDDVQNQLEKALSNDDTLWQEKQRITYKSGCRAERIEHAVFICPECGAYASISSKGDTFTCGRCGNGWQINDFGFFETIEEGKNAQHKNLRDWIAWQNSRLKKDLLKLKKYTELFSDKGCTLFSGFKTDPLKHAGRGTAHLINKGLEFRYENGSIKQFPAAELKGLTIQEGETLEFYHDEHCYQFQFDGFVSACKWISTLETIRSIS